MEKEEMKELVPFCDNKACRCHTLQVNPWCAEITHPHRPGFSLLRVLHADVNLYLCDTCSAAVDLFQSKVVETLQQEEQDERLKLWTPEPKQIVLPS